VADPDRRVFRPDQRRHEVRRVDHPDGTQGANRPVISGDLVESVRSLSSQDGDAILMHGFGPVAKTLLREGLLDELHLWYHPVFAGVGDEQDMLFDPGLNIHLEQTGTQTLKSGVVVLSYTPRRSAQGSSANPAARNCSASLAGRR